jgi:hypothetical protein
MSTSTYLPERVSPAGTVAPRLDESTSVHPALARSMETTTGTIAVLLVSRDVPDVRWNGLDVVELHEAGVDGPVVTIRQKPRWLELSTRRLTLEIPGTVAYGDVIALVKHLRERALEVK